MITRLRASFYCAPLSLCLITAHAAGQGIQPYPNAITDRSVRQETFVLPPAKNTIVVDPDFGSSILRVTDPATNFKLPGTPIRTEGSGKANEWSSSTDKFYVIGDGGQVFAFGFDPATMTVSSLSGAKTGQGLLISLRPGPSFSSIDPDLIYGTTSRNPLTISSYRFSSGVTSSVVDTTTCSLQPQLSSSARSDDDVTPSTDDSRLSISEGGTAFGNHMFVVVFDKRMGCRWYNTQTGQIGGQWGTAGLASVTTPYFIRHAYLSRSGKYVVILVDWFGWYVWDLETLSVTPCANGSALECGGYSATGYNSFINGPAILDDMQTVKRSLNDLPNYAQLLYPVPSPGSWGQPQHFTWNNVDVNDSVPICGSTHNYEGDTEINQPFQGEIFCMETDGVASTVWRFAHNRATYVSPYFNTQPLGSVSRDGKFFLFSSDWDGQLGLAVNGKPDSAAFIVKLD